MLEIMDYSKRRGAIVPLLGKVHALMTENARKDILSGIKPPENIILWRQVMNRALVDTQTRWLFTLDGAAIAGLLFYHFGDNKTLYIDELQLAWSYRHNNAAFTLLLDKFQTDREVAACGIIYASEQVKSDESTEKLASVGLKEEYPDGWQPLGTLSEAVNTLKLRYLR